MGGDAVEFQTSVKYRVNPTIRDVLLDQESGSAVQ